MIEELSQMPDADGLFRRAVAASVRRRGVTSDRLPDTELVVAGVQVDRDRLSHYDSVCGFRVSDTLPATYPHVVAFPLTLGLMTREDFPLPLIGMVHIQNTIEQQRPLAAGESLDLRVRAENLRTHERGRAVDLVVSATVDGDVVWRSRSVYLRRTSGGGRSRDGGSGERPRPPRATAVWRVGADVGAAYAAVSDDRNPIHTSTIAARLFGFPRRIAHGMWSKARCLAALEGRLPDRLTVDAAFKLPILLPATVAYSAERDARGEWRFALHDAASGRPHLTGSVTP